MNRPWMPLYVADYRADTAHLSAAQHGAYLLLIMHYWQTGGLPQDDGALSRIACMGTAEWRKNRVVIASFFSEDWRHGRIDLEIGKAEVKQERRSEAGKRGGIASAKAKQNSSNATTIAQASSSLSQSERKKDSEADASGADAPIDHRKRLFDEGLPKLARMTGKGPDACRSFVGKCLKAASDDAVTVLGLIEDAERNQVVNPSAWIAARLKPMENGNGKAQGGSLIAALDRALEQSVAEDADFAASANPVLSLPGRSIQRS